jgi:alkylation response protein AidB-like acyl-CoA dehydrogenase
MNFQWSDTQKQQYDEVVAFATEHLNHDLAGRDERREFDADAWRKCAERGVLGWCFPAEYGGGGLDVVTTIRLLEGLGYGCRDNGLTLAINGQMWSVQEPLLHVGDEDQKRRFLAPLCRGEMLAAHGMTEPESGSDSYALQTTAVRTDGGYILNGHKIYIGLSPVADIALIFARTNPDAGKWGISAFIVEATSDGYAASPAQPKMGLRTGPLGEIRLTDCFVPEANRLGPEGAGVSIFTSSMDWERAFIFASHVGSMARQLDECVTFAREREQFGQPIGKFGAVSTRLADMRVRLETSRLLLYKLAWMKGEGMQAINEAAMAKLHLAESFVANSMDAIRIHGGRGYLSEYEVERDLRDAIGGVIYSGTSDIQRNIIAACLGV